MKLRNKKTGEIVEDGYVRETHDFQFDGQKHVLAIFKGNGHRPPERVSGPYNSLAELNEEWEDMPEEPKGMKDVYVSGFCKNGVMIEFETEEEAEKAVEKLKAWKRLKDRGFKIEGWMVRSDADGTIINVGISFGSMNKKIAKDLDICFGGEE